jgi:hypothetical protein
MTKDTLDARIARAERRGRNVGIAIIALVGCPIAYLIGGWSGLLLLLLWVMVMPALNRLDQRRGTNWW